MARPIETVVRDVLAVNGRSIKFRHAIGDAWSALKANYPERARWRRKSTRAAIVWEESVDRAITAFHDDLGTHVVSHFDTISFIFDDTVLMRVKKVDMELQSRNVQTSLSTLFHRHDEDLFGYQGLQRVEAGYVLNRFETEIAWVGVVAREDDEQLFHFDFNDVLAPAQTIIPFPAVAKSSPAEIARLRTGIVDEKKNGDKKNDESGG